jgi:hypothetical protein
MPRLVAVAVSFLKRHQAQYGRSDETNPHIARRSDTLDASPHASASIGDREFGNALAQCAESCVSIYRAHIVMGTGQNDTVIHLDCSDDVGALAAAEALVDGHDVEVWLGFRKLGTLHCHAEKSPNVVILKKKANLDRGK